MKKTLLLGLLFLFSTVYARIVDVRDYGIVPGKDVTLELNNLIQTLKDEEGVTLSFPHGQYDFYPDNAVEEYRAVANHDNGLKRMAFALYGHRNLTIDGNGSLFLFHGRMVPFTLDRVHTVTLKNIVIDYVRPFHAELTVIARDEATNSLVLEVDPAQYPYSFKQGQLYFDRLGQRDGFTGQNIVFDPKTRAPIYNAAEYRLNENTLKLEPAGANRIKLINGFNKMPPEGSVLIMYGDATTSRLCHAIQVVNSANIVLDNLEIRAAGGMGLIVERTENVRLLGMKITSGPNRLISTRADATHFIGCKGVIELENCLFEHMLDDGINVHGAYVPVVERLAENAFLCEISHQQQWGLTFAEPGDKVAILSRKTLLPFYETTIKAVQRLNEKRFIITLQALPPELPGVPLSLENLSWNPDLVMRHNIIRENRARSVLVTTKGKVLIENNYFSSQMNGILIEGDNDYWYESGAVQDVVIRNNTFVNIGFGSRKSYPLLASPKLTPEQKMGEGRYHRNIAFHDNTIRTFTGNLVHARSVENLSFKRNQIEFSTDYPAGQPMESVLLEYCRNVDIADNTVSGFARPLTVSAAMDSELIQMAGNKGLQPDQSGGIASPVVLGTPGLRSHDLSNYECLVDGFPRTLLFRSGNIVRWQEQGVLDHHLGMFDADTRKYVGEETEFNQDWIDIMSAYKQRHPRKLSLVHLNGEARGGLSEQGHKYFPGHWTFYPGETLHQDLSASDRIIKVDNPELFSSRTYRKRERGQQTESLLPPLIIVPLRPDGSKDWSRSEYVDLVAVNQQEKTLTLERGKYFSQAREFVSGQAYIAPIHSEYWGMGTMWTLNLSAQCPRDAQGRSAGDIWLEEIKAWCGTGGLAQHVDGIGFDVIFFKAKNQQWDLDTDGKTDAGIDRSGDDFNTRGQYELLKRLRSVAGPDFILTSDAWEHRTQRAVGVFNGMESEGLCMPNDGWRKIAETINTQRYWAQQGNAKYHYSYITSKLMHPEDEKMADQLYRMGLGTACALGVSYTGAALPRRTDDLPMIPEMHRGGADEPNWLGQPVREMQVLARKAPDLFHGQGRLFTAEMVAKLKTEQCQVSLGADGSLLIEGTADNPYAEMVVTLPALPVPAGDLVVFLDALALQPLAGYPPGDRIPRQITMHAAGMPKVPSDQIGNRPMYNDIMALMGTAAWQENCAYFRHAGAGAGSITITLRIENQGSCRIRNLTAHNAPLALVREFEHGVVLVNASQVPLDFNLAEIFPDAWRQGLWRIKADPKAYLPSPATERTLRINNGRKLDVARVTLPPLEGFFLCKQAQ